MNRVIPGSGNKLSIPSGGNQPSVVGKMSSILIRNPTLKLSWSGSGGVQLDATLSCIGILPNTPVNLYLRVATGVGMPVIAFLIEIPPNADPQVGKAVAKMPLEKFVIGVSTEDIEADDSMIENIDIKQGLNVVGLLNLDDDPFGSFFVQMRQNAPDEVKGLMPGAGAKLCVYLVVTIQELSIKIAFTAPTGLVRALSFAVKTDYTSVELEIEATFWMTVKDLDPKLLLTVSLTVSTDSLEVAGTAALEGTNRLVAPWKSPKWFALKMPLHLAFGINLYSGIPSLFEIGAGIAIGNFELDVAFVYTLIPPAVAACVAFKNLDFAEINRLVNSDKCPDCPASPSKFSVGSAVFRFNTGPPKVLDWATTPECRNINFGIFVKFEDLRLDNWYMDACVYVGVGLSFNIQMDEIYIPEIDLYIGKNKDNFCVESSAFLGLGPPVMPKEEFGSCTFKKTRTGLKAAMSLEPGALPNLHVDGNIKFLGSDLKICMVRSGDNPDYRLGAKLTIFGMLTAQIGVNIDFSKQFAGRLEVKGIGDFNRYIIQKVQDAIIGPMLAAADKLDEAVKIFDGEIEAAKADVRRAKEQAFADIERAKAAINAAKNKVQQWQDNTCGPMRAGCKDKCERTIFNTILCFPADLGKCIGSGFCDFGAIVGKGVLDLGSAILDFGKIVVNGILDFAVMFLDGIKAAAYGFAAMYRAFVNGLSSFFDFLKDALGRPLVDYIAASFKLSKDVQRMNFALSGWVFGTPYSGSTGDINPLFPWEIIKGIFNLIFSGCKSMAEAKMSDDSSRKSMTKVMNEMKDGNGEEKIRKWNSKKMVDDAKPDKENLQAMTGTSSMKVGPDGKLRDAQGRIVDDNYGTTVEHARTLIHKVRSAMTEEALPKLKSLIDRHMRMDIINPETNDFVKDTMVFSTLAEDGTTVTTDSSNPQEMELFVSRMMDKNIQGLAREDKIKNGEPIEIEPPRMSAAEQSVICNILPHKARAGNHFIILDGFTIVANQVRCLLAESSRLLDANEGSNTMLFRLNNNNVDSLSCSDWDISDSQEWSLDLSDSDVSCNPLNPNLKKATRLFLSGNPNVGGDIAMFAGNTHIQSLFLQQTKFYGCYVETFASMPKLMAFDITNTLINHDLPCNALPAFEDYTLRNCPAGRLGEATGCQFFCRGAFTRGSPCRAIFETAHTCTSICASVVQDSMDYCHRTLHQPNLTNTCRCMRFNEAISRTCSGNGQSAACSTLYNAPMASVMPSAWRVARDISYEVRSYPSNEWAMAWADALEAEAWGCTQQTEIDQSKAHLNRVRRCHLERYEVMDKCVDLLTLKSANFTATAVCACQTVRHRFLVNFVNTGICSEDFLRMNYTELLYISDDKLSGLWHHAARTLRVNGVGTNEGAYRAMVREFNEITLRDCPFESLEMYDAFAEIEAPRDAVYRLCSLVTVSWKSGKIYSPDVCRCVNAVQDPACVSCTTLFPYVTLANTNWWPVAINPYRLPVPCPIYRHDEHATMYVNGSVSDLRSLQVIGQLNAMRALQVDLAEGLAMEYATGVQIVSVQDYTAAGKPFDHTLELHIWCSYVSYFTTAAKLTASAVYATPRWGLQAHVATAAVASVTHTVEQGFGTNGCLLREMRPTCSCSPANVPQGAICNVDGSSHTFSGCVQGACLSATSESHPVSATSTSQVNIVALVNISSGCLGSAQHGRGLIDGLLVRVMAPHVILHYTTRVDASVPGVQTFVLDIVVHKSTAAGSPPLAVGSRISFPEPLCTVPWTICPCFYTPSSLVVISATSPATVSVSSPFATVQRGKMQVYIFPCDATSSVRTASWVNTRSLKLQLMAAMKINLEDVTRFNLHIDTSKTSTWVLADFAWRHVAMNTVTPDGTALAQHYVFMSSNNVELCTQSLVQRLETASVGVMSHLCQVLNITLTLPTPSGYVRSSNMVTEWTAALKTRFGPDVTFLSRSAGATMQFSVCTHTLGRAASTAVVIAPGATVALSSGATLTVRSTEPAELEVSLEADVPPFGFVEKDDTRSDVPVGRPPVRTDTATESMTFTLSETMTHPATATFTLSDTITAPESLSRSFTLSHTASETLSSPVTTSLTASNTWTTAPTSSSSSSISWSQTMSFSDSQSWSDTVSPSFTWTSSASASWSVSDSASPSFSTSFSPTSSWTSSFTPTPSFSSTQSMTQADTRSPSFSASRTASWSMSNSASDSLSFSVSNTDSPSWSFSATVSKTLSLSTSRSASRTVSVTVSLTRTTNPTMTTTLSLSKSGSRSLSISESFSNSYSDSATFSRFVTRTLTRSLSGSATPSMKHTHSGSTTRSASTSSSTTFTSSFTLTHVQSPSVSSSVSGTKSAVVWPTLPPGAPPTAPVSVQGKVVLNISCSKYQEAPKDLQDQWNDAVVKDLQAWCGYDSVCHANITNVECGSVKFNFVMWSSQPLVVTQDVLETAIETNTFSFNITISYLNEEKVPLKLTDEEISAARQPLEVSVTRNNKSRVLSTGALTGIVIAVIAFSVVALIGGKVVYDMTHTEVYENEPSPSSKALPRPSTAEQRYVVSEQPISPRLSHPEMFSPSGVHPVPDRHVNVTDEASGASEAEVGAMDKITFPAVVTAT